MKILITGANGNLAKVVANKLNKNSISVVSCSSKPINDQIYFDLHSELNEMIFNGITHIFHFATSPIYEITNTETQFLNLAVKKNIKIVYFGSTSSYLNDITIYGRYKKKIEDKVLKLGGIVITCGLIYGKDFNGQISQAARHLSHLPFTVILKGSKKIYLTSTSRVVDILLDIINSTNFVSGRYLLLQTPAIDLNDLLFSLSRFKFLRLVVPLKFVGLALSSKFVFGRYFHFDRVKSIYSDFHEDLFNNTIDSSVEIIKWREELLK